MAGVFEVLGTAHREVEQMLDRMQAMMGAPVQLREGGGAWRAHVRRDRGIADAQLFTESGSVRLQTGIPLRRGILWHQGTALVKQGRG